MGPPPATDSKASGSRKRPKLESQRDSDSDDDASSTADTVIDLENAAERMSELQNDVDEDITDDANDGFKLVSHRKKRSTGVPVLLQPATEANGKSLQRLNPIILSKAVAEAAGAAPLRHRFTDRGGLLLDVETEVQVNRLLQCVSICGIPIETKIPGTYQRTTGLVKGVPKWYTDAELLDFLAQQGITYARRLVQHRKGPGGEIKVYPTDRVVLSFAPNSERPAKVNLGFTIHEVIDHIEAPSRCFKCQRYGHIAKFCRSDARCKYCGGPHEHKNCKEESRKCANCGGPHPASFSGCWMRTKALHRTKNFLLGPHRTSKDERDQTIPKQVEERAGPAPKSMVVEPSVDQLVQKMKTQLKHQRASRPAAERKKSSSQQQSEKATALPPMQGNASREHNQASKRIVSNSDKHRHTSISDPDPNQDSSGRELISAIFLALRSIISTMTEGTSKEALKAILALESAVINASKSRSFCSCHA